MSPAGGSSLTLSVTDTTTNDGVGAVASSVTRFYLSSNSSFDATDTLLDGARAVPALDAGVGSSGTTTVTLPAATPAGTYYLVARADADGAVVETSETNNTLAKSVYVGSDLVVTEISAPAKGGAGAAITVSDTTSNDGAGAAAASVTRFYFSANASWDVSDILLAGAHTVPALAAGAGDTSSTTADHPGE